MLSRTQLALAGLVLFGLGSIAGALVTHKPPPPVAVSTKTEQSAKLDQIAQHEARTDDVASVFRVLPGVKVTTRKTTYQPVKPQLPPFPGSPQICNCPMPVVASIEETTSETGQGSESINAASSSHVKDAAASSGESHSNSQRNETPTAKLPRLTIGAGGGAQPLNEYKPVLALDLGLRITDTVTLRVVATAPPTDPKQVSLVGMLELGVW